MSAPLDVLVVGGGATASVTALAAAAAGLSVRHIRGDSAVRGRRYALSRRSVRLLQRLNACPPLQPVAGFDLYAGGRWHDLCDAAPLCHMAEEGALAEALAAALAVSTVHTTHSEEAIHWQGADEECVALSVGGVAMQARLLAVADGASSPLAAQLGITAAVRDFKQQALVAQVVAPSLRADAAYQWFAQNDILALLPAGTAEEPVFSMVWSTASASALAAAKEGAEAVTAALTQRTGLAEVRIVGQVSAFPLRAQVRAARVAPRAALLGDAAGVVHPLAGQGLNLGLADAEELVRCTAPRLRGDIALGLAAYSNVRSRRQWQLQGLTRALLNERVAAGVLGLSRLPLLRQAAVMFANG